MSDGEEKRRITVSPQIHAPGSTSSMMWNVSAALLPAAIWGIYVFGLGALGTILVSIVACVLTEFVIARLLARFTLVDGSAVLTGLLIGLNLPPEIPIYIPIVASVFAIAVVKWTFGGLGTNWMNPALAGRVVVFFSWTAHMTNWRPPGTINPADAVSGATVLGTVKSALFQYSGDALGPMQMLREAAYPRTAFDVRITDAINGVLDRISASIPGGYVDMFVGNIAGSIGEISALLLLLGAAYLLIRKIITWHIPVSFLASFGILVFLFGGLRFGAGVGDGNVIFHFLSGGLFLGAFYMATDMVTSPLSRRGMIIFGVGIGFFTFLIRFYGSFPEGVSLAIILMNVFVPFINRYTKPRRFGVEAKS